MLNICKLLIERLCSSLESDLFLIYVICQTTSLCLINKILKLIICHHLFCGIFKQGYASRVTCGIHY